MTVTSEVSRSGPYNGNGATTVFPYEFKIFTAADLLVTEVDLDGIETTLVNGVDYTVDGVLSDDGGDVTLTTALSGDGTDAGSHKLTIRRVLDATQTMNLRSQGKISAEVLERAHDRAVMLIQQLFDERSRSLRLVESEAGNELLTLLPALADRKGRQLTFDPATGQPTASSPTSAAVSAAMKDTVASATLALARAAMGPWGDAVVTPTGAAAPTTLSAILASIGSYPTGVGTEDRANQHTYDPATSALRCGASDTESQNDERNFWRGLSSLGGATPGGDSNAWGTPALIGLFSVAFNRNGVAYGTYSATFGHDCITYGIASMAGGAGSCAGDPDAPTSPAFEGYCSLAWGKNCLASGSKAIALGEETKAQARGSIAAGYASETDGDGADAGTGSVALGYSAKANGNGSVALGRDVIGGASPYSLYYAQVASGGTGYTANDVLTVAGGTGTAATIRVDTVSGGVITAVTVLTRGTYTVKPTSPNSSTGGTGTGASLTLGWFEGGIAIGLGANPGSPMRVGGGRLGLGVNVVRPTLEFLPADNPAADDGTVVLRGTAFLRQTVVTGGDDLNVSAIIPVATNSGGGGYGGVHFKALVAGALTDGWMVDAGNVSGGVCLYPVADNATRLGAAAKRPSVLYAVTGTINTSDEREKQDIEDIPDTWLDAWAEVKFQRFHWRDSVAIKGDGARWHVGVIAQRVLDAFARHGIDAMEIGVLCYDSWTDADTGEARDRYGVRYEQALALECALMRRRMDRLEALS